ncbi:hypothetical protein SynRS9915_00164 [Synechococcus sp. RS9915]|nr:hypothetical protein SynRS9915_00164 [Synechococcus sp. RS9915]
MSSFAPKPCQSLNMLLLEEQELSHTPRIAAIAGTPNVIDV